MDEVTPDSARHYQLIVEAIACIHSQAHQLPSLAEIAQQIGVSDITSSGRFPNGLAYRPNVFCST